MPAWTDCGAGRQGLYFVDARICTDCGAIVPGPSDCSGITPQVGDKRRQSIAHSSVWMLRARLAAACCATGVGAAVDYAIIGVPGGVCL